MKKLLSFFAVLSLLLTSCEGVDLGGAAGKLEDLFSLTDVEKLDGFAAEGGRVTLPFTSEYDWTASSNRQWIEVTPESGSAGENVNLRVALDKNTTGEERTGKVFVELSNNKSYEIPVRQLAKGGVQEETPVVELVDGGYYSINPNGGSLEVRVRTNTEYEVSISASWLVHTDTRAMRDETIVFTAQKNESNSSREAMVSLYYGDGESAKFVVYQEAAPQGGDVEEPVLELVDSANYSINPNGGDIDIQVRSNMAYSVEIEAPWLHENKTRTVTTSVVSLYAEKNDTGAARSTVVVLRGEDNASVSFTVSQDPAQEDLFSTADVEKLDGFAAEGGSVTLSFTSKYDWTASSNRQWIEVTPESGSAGENVLSVVLAENTTGEERTGKVFVELSNNKSYGIPVRQLAKGGVQEETPVVELVDGGYYSINPNGGSLEVRVRTNTEYEVSISASWLVHTDTRAMRDETIVFTAQKNESNSSREAKVSLNYGDGENVEFKIYQEADVEEPVLELVDGAYYSINPNGGDIDIQVLSNMAYSVEIEASWLHENKTRTVTKSVVSLYAEKNNTGAVRSTVVVLRGEDNASVSFTVSQEPAQEDVVDASIAVSPKTIYLGADGGQQQITVTSNAEWSVSCTESGVSVSPLSGSGDGVVTITVPATSVSRTFSVDFEASNATSTAKASVVVSQSVSGNESGMTPGEHQAYLEQTGHRLLAYFNPEDSYALATSVTELANAGGFDFYLESTTRNAGSAHSVQYAKKLAAAVSGMTRYSPMSAVKLSTSLVLPWEEGTYCLDDYKGKQYDFNFETGKWRESSLGNVNKMVANWGNSTATLVWVEGTSSWEGFVEYGETAKVENIPSSIALEIAVNNNIELSAMVEIQLPTNYSIDTQTLVWLKGDYNFKVCANADRHGVGGSVIISKRGETLVTGGGSVAINDLTDSNNWWQKYYCEWCEMYHSDINFDYPVDQVKTGNAYATILDVGLSVQGDLRSIIDEGKKIENTESYDGAMLLSNYINSYALAQLYYTGSKEKIADVKAEPMADEYWDWDYNTNQEVLKTYYTPMPILVFTDGSKFAVDQYFTEMAFGNLIDAAEELMNKYVELVD